MNKVWLVTGSLFMRREGVSPVLLELVDFVEIAPE
jgi:hypothetical protein